MIIYMASLITMVVTLLGIDAMMMQIWLTGRSNLNVVFVTLASTFTVLMDVITLIGVMQNVPFRHFRSMPPISRVFWIIISIFAVSLFVYFPYVSIRHYLEISIPIESQSLAGNGLLSLGMVLYNSSLALVTYIVYSTIKSRMFPDIYGTVAGVMNPVQKGFSPRKNRDDVQEV